MPCGVLSCCFSVVDGMHITVLDWHLAALQCECQSSMLEDKRSCFQRGIHRSTDGAHKWVVKIASLTHLRGFANRHWRQYT